MARMIVDEHVPLATLDVSASFAVQVFGKSNHWNRQRDERHDGRVPHQSVPDEGRLTKREDALTR